MYDLSDSKYRYEIYYENMYKPPLSWDLLLPQASLTFESNVYLNFLSAREQDGCRVRLLRSHQISSPPFTLRHSARVTGKSCVSKTPNLEGQEVSFNGKDFFRFVTLVEV